MLAELIAFAIIGTVLAVVCFLVNVGKKYSGAPPLKQADQRQVAPFRQHSPMEPAPPPASQVVTPTIPIILPKEDCQILFRSKAVKRIGWLGVHLHCEIVVSNEGLTFTDHDEPESSFHIPIGSLLRIPIADDPRTGRQDDLLLTVPDGRKYDIGLDTGVKDAVRDTVRQMKRNIIKHRIDNREE